MNSIEHTNSLDFPEFYTSIEPVSNSTMKRYRCNVTIKGDGGVIGQKHDAEALKYLASPKVARVIADFESTVDSTNAAEQAAPKRHHEQTKAFQKSLSKTLSHWSK